MYEYRTPVRVDVNTIDCEINHSNYGWIWFSACANDTEPSGVALFNQIETDADNSLVVIEGD